MRYGWLFGLFLTLFTGTTWSAEITFLPQWVPQAQFAGYYMALHTGIYDRYGLHVTILDGGPDKPPDAFLTEGRVDAATLWLAQGIFLRSHGVPLVNLAQIVQHSALMLVGRKASMDTGGIKALQGKRVSLWGGVFSVPAQALFKKHHLTVKALPQGFSVNLFLQGLVDVTSAMWYNEYYKILLSGLDPEELTTFPFRDMGFDFPEDGIYVLEKTFEENPEVWRAFVAASLEGWLYAFAHPEETLDVIMANLLRVHVPASRVHQRWMLDRMRDIILPSHGDGEMGVLKANAYENVARTLQQLDIINYIPSYNELYRGKKEDEKVR
ncbi:nitrate ABC transporter substrate-binding protein [Thermodesulfomicrobium sp. WS]|uniref:ABC transporter substrate-binding protein n=1 Tax=Thermodesulfomicrobium sp. WS TaxID=3004129 RepID=UPI00248F62EC|nr:ABC transporter substrate-binding protein [Thermodesulfomicrobium sp. WS]BDV01952.1 nitrate ABC transporter substrate-binding protein [Thermodesulfomicrobium sp. WS]